MNEVNRTEPTRPLVSRNARSDTEGSRQVEGQAANVRQAGGNQVPAVQPKPEPEGRALENIQSIRSRVDEAVASLNEYARKSERNLEFSVDSELGLPVVQVIDSTTREVIRQIPSETALSVARNLQANLEQLDMHRAAHQAGLDGFTGADLSLGLVNTHA